MLSLVTPAAPKNREAEDVLRLMAEGLKRFGRSVNVPPRLRFTLSFLSWRRKMAYMAAKPRGSPNVTFDGVINA